MPELSLGQGKRLVVERGDITACDTDAIVNAANPAMAGGGGVDGAIHRAGGAVIAEESARVISRIGRLEPGSAVSTGAGLLPARRVVHTVGPIWRGGDRGEAEILASAYRSSLEVADAEGLRSVAFPSISTGAYGYPLRPAASVAVAAAAMALSKAVSVKEVFFVLFDDATYAAYRGALEDYAGEVLR